MAKVPKDTTVCCFVNGFRAPIPIYKNKSRFYTTYDFEGNRLKGNDTVYVSEKGNDAKSGKKPEEAKKTVEAALRTKSRDIILLEGYYKAGVNFKNGTPLFNINFIGEGNVVIDNMGGTPFIVLGNIFIRNIQFVNGNRGSLRTYLENPYNVCTYVCCKFNHSLVDNVDVSKAQSLGGLRIQGGTHYLYRCEASLNGYDGFSYHAAPDGSNNAPHVIEVECKAFHNGRQNLYESNNASTAHDGTHVIRLNCKYGYSHGGNVADVHKNTVSFNIGCTCNYVMDLGVANRKYQSNYFCANNAVMYLLGCGSYGAFYDISCWNDGTMFLDRKYRNEYDKGGSVKMISR